MNILDVLKSINEEDVAYFANVVKLTDEAMDECCANDRTNGNNEIVRIVELLKKSGVNSEDSLMPIVLWKAAKEQSHE